MKGKRGIVGYAIREVDGLRGWFHKRNNKGVYLDSSKTKAKVYLTERGAASVAKWLNNLLYSDGWHFRFEVVPITATQGPFQKIENTPLQFSAKCDIICGVKGKQGVSPDNKDNKERNTKDERP